MKKKLRYFILLLLSQSFFQINCNGQQQAMFTQYMFNGLALNPAYAGSQGALSATFLARKQWLGFEGSPSTQTFSLHSPILDKNFSAGILFVNDQIGKNQQTGGTLCFSYQIKFPKSTLSMGAQGGFTNYRLGQLAVRDLNDPNFGAEEVNRFMPQIGTGFYYYSDRMYVGLSIPQLLTHYYNLTSDISTARSRRHYFLTGGYVFDLNPNLKIKPSLLVKAVEGAPVSVDLNTNLLIKDVIWVGLSYRSFESIDALLELQLTNQLKLGYAYDFSTSSQIRSVTKGTHELMLNYRFSFSKNKLITPRYF